MRREKAAVALNNFGTKATAMAPFVLWPVGRATSRPPTLFLLLGANERRCASSAYRAFA